MDGDGGWGSTRVSNASITRSVEHKSLQLYSLKSFGFDFPATEDDFD